MLENPELARESIGSVAPAMGVSTLVRSIRDLLEHRFPLLRVSGEISNYVLARSGHAYFVLKDAQAQVRCVMFRQRNQYLDWQPRDGMQVEVQALLTLYEARGDIQLTVESMRQSGAGQLFEQFQQLREKLAAEGLFDTEDKRPLPGFPRSIGVVTSTEAAALRDVLTTLARRNPSIPVIVYPVPVQGSGAAQKIVEALHTLGASGRCELIILARGGGSIEDLWAFNEEIVARAIRACAVPVVTGIGHETDFTIADFAADCRAPTPTAAAELCSPDRNALLQRMQALSHRLSRNSVRGMERRMQRLDALAARLQHPGHSLRLQLQRLAGLRDQLAHCTATGLADRQWQLRSLLHRCRAQLPRPSGQSMKIQSLALHLRTVLRAQQDARAARLTRLQAALAHLAPERILSRGYSVVRDAQGKVVTRAAQLAIGDALDITLAEGGALARVDRTRR